MPEALRSSIWAAELFIAERQKYNYTINHELSRDKILNFRPSLSHSARCATKSVSQSEKKQIFFVLTFVGFGRVAKKGHFVSQGEQSRLNLIELEDISRLMSLKQGDS